MAKWWGVGCYSGIRRYISYINDKEFFATLYITDETGLYL